jgi:hypothetical protein
MNYSEYNPNASSQAPVQAQAVQANQSQQGFQASSQASSYAPIMQANQSQQRYQNASQMQQQRGNQQTQQRQQQQRQPQQRQPVQQQQRQPVQQQQRQQQQHQPQQRQQQQYQPQQRQQQQHQPQQHQPQQRQQQQHQPQQRQQQHQPQQRQQQHQPQQRQQVQQQQRNQEKYSNIDPSKPMLFYSVNCKYSSLFMNYLGKNKMLKDNFMCVQIDPDPLTRERTPIFYQIQMLLQKSITSVPTLVLDGRYTLTGKEAFKWLEDVLNKNSEIKGFNTFEMDQFSDKYADLQTDISKTDQIHLEDTVYDTATGQYIQKQNFKFLQEKDEFMATPEESGEREPSQYKNQRDNVDNLLQGQHKMNISFQDSQTSDSFSNMKKDREIHQIQRKEIDFTDNNFGLSGKISGSIKSAKRSDIDDRFQELSAMRDTSPVSSGVSKDEIDQFIRSGRM